MDCFPTHVRRKIAAAGADFIAAQIERIHTRLLKSRQPTVSVKYARSEEEVTIGHCLVVWQAQLHRVERLMVSCGAAIASHDTYALATLVRAHLESVAMFASLMLARENYASGLNSYEAYDKVVSAALFGSKTQEGSSLSAMNILTHIQRAEKLLKRNYSLSEPISLQDAYSILSEYAHPNLSSTMASFDVVEPGVYKFNHGAKITTAHLQMLGILRFNSELFLSMSEALVGAEYTGGTASR